MHSYNEVLQRGEKVKDWERGEVFEYKDQYYFLDHKKEKIVMEGNFI